MAGSSLLRSSCAHHWLHSSQNGVFVISCTTRAAILACAEIQPSNKTVCGPGFLHHSSAKYPDTKASLATNSSVDDGYIGRQHARPMPRSLLALGRFALLDCFKRLKSGVGFRRSSGVGLSSRAIHPPLRLAGTQTERFDEQCASPSEDTYAGDHSSTTSRATIGTNFATSAGLWIAFTTVWSRRHGNHVPSSKRRHHQHCPVR